MAGNHVTDPDGIMSRGFEKINRLFMVEEAGVIFSEEVVKWENSTATILSQSEWLE